jgi:hypothetical protein
MQAPSSMPMTSYVEPPAPMAFQTPTAPATSYGSPATGGFTSNPGGQIPGGPAGPATGPSSWYGKLSDEVGALGFDDFTELAQNAFGGMNNSQGGGAAAMYPPMNPAQSLGPVGQAGSQYFHSLYGGGNGRQGGGLF